MLASHELAGHISDLQAPSDPDELEGKEFIGLSLSDEHLELFWGAERAFYM